MIKGKFRKRLAVVALILLLLLSTVLGVTIAYFRDSTNVVRNTFVGGTLFNDPDVDFQLVEEEAVETTKEDSTFTVSKYKLNPSVTVTAQTYDVLPGVPIPKRPYIKIDRLLMDAFLFVEVNPGGKFVENNGTWTSTDDMITWSMADNWTLMPAEMQPNDGRRIYYYKKSADGILDASEYAAAQIELMNQSHVTKTAGDQTFGYAVDVSPEYDSPIRSDISISFKAYICQASGDGRNLNAVEAWDAIMTGSNG